MTECTGAASVRGKSGRTGADVLSLSPSFGQESPLSILCLGAHSDDIEIGALATVLSLASRYPDASITWAVFSASGERLAEARESADYCARGFSSLDFLSFEFEDGLFPAQYADLQGRCE